MKRSAFAAVVCSLVAFATTQPVRAQSPDAGPSPHAALAPEPKPRTADARAPDARAPDARAPDARAPDGRAPDARRIDENRAGDADAVEPAPITARDVASAPRPNETRGLATPDPSRETSVVRSIGRGLLSLPRWGFQLAMQPFRGALYAYERYRLRDRFNRIFFNETGTFGLFPSLFFETGFGLNAGARMVHRDLFGEHESLAARVGWGGHYRQRYSLKADSGERLGRVQLELSGQIEIRDRDRFVGIGDRDLVEPTDIAGPLDPLGSGPVVESRYRQRFTRLRAAANVHIAGPLSIRASTGIVDRKLSDDGVTASGDPVISDAYDVDRLPGFDQNPRLGYTELELRYQTKRRASRYVPSPWWSTGWDLRTFGGYATGLGDDPSRFFRYGLDLQRYVNLLGGTRVVVFRLYGDGLSEDPGRRVPFTELPSLGGNHILRGYPQSRFRDRYIEAGSVEYQFDVNAGSYAYLFVDAGKALRDIDADAVDNLRLGFGGGLQLNSDKSFLARILVAGTKDGDMLFSLTFEPQFESDERFDRR